MKKGDIVLCADKAGDFTSKSRPVVVQNSAYIPNKESLIVCPASAAVVDNDLVMLLEPSPENGLKSASIIREDLITTVKVFRVGKKIGELSASDMLRLNEILRNWLKPRSGAWIPRSPGGFMLFLESWKKNKTRSSY